MLSVSDVDTMEHLYVRIFWDENFQKSSGAREDTEVPRPISLRTGATKEEIKATRQKRIKTTIQHKNKDNM